MDDWVFTLILAVILAAISVADYRSFRIPDGLSLALVFAGVTAVLALRPEALFAHGIAGLVGFGLLFVIGEIYFRLRGVEHLGIGDAKLFGAGLIWVGPLGGASVLLFACLGGIAFGVLRGARVGFEAAQPIPFAPFLSVSILMVWTGGPVWV